MTESYSIDLEQFSLARLQHILESGDVLPGRVILKEKIAERFAILESMGITNLKQLVDALSNKKKVGQFSLASGLPVDYLTILGRQARSYIPGPVYFKDIPGIDPLHVDCLASVGIKQTRQLFERALTRRSREALARQIPIPLDVMLELIKLADLARAGWVGPVFARLLYETGVDTLTKLAEASPAVLFEKLRAVNDQRGLTKAFFSLKDVTACVETAKELPKMIEY